MNNKTIIYNKEANNKIIIIKSVDKYIKTKKVYILHYIYIIRNLTLNYMENMKKIEVY